jgi:hypothetical protein
MPHIFSDFVVNESKFVMELKTHLFFLLLLLLLLLVLSHASPFLESE